MSAFLYSAQNKRTCNYFGKDLISRGATIVSKPVAFILMYALDSLIKETQSRKYSVSSLFWLSHSSLSQRPSFGLPWGFQCTKQVQCKMCIIVLSTDSGANKTVENNITVI